MFYLDVDDITLGGSSKTQALLPLSTAGKGFGNIYDDNMRDGNWYYYDNGVNDDAIGLTSGGGFYWGIMFPAGTYEGNKLTKISYFDYSAHTGVVSIYQGGTSAPGTLLYSQNYSVSGSETTIEIVMDEPVVLDETQNVWVVMHNNNGQYVASIDSSIGVQYGSCISIDGSEWYMTVSSASGGQLDGNWNLRAYIETGGGSVGGTVYVPNKYNIFLDNEWQGSTSSTSFTLTAPDEEEHEYMVVYVDSNYGISCEAIITYSVAGGGSCDPVTNLTAIYHEQNGQQGALIEWNAPAGAVAYKVYFEGQLLGQTSETSIFIYGFEDPGLYTFGVTAVYSNCESDMATVDFEWGSGVDEVEIVSAIYPNPTSGDLHIDATAMTHVSVFNAMGQMVYDQAVNADAIVLNMGQFEAGVYMVRIDTANGSSVKRITVTK